MTKATLADLMEEQVFAIVRELKDRMYPLQTIIEEVTVLTMPRIVFFVTTDGTRVAFDRRFVTLLQKRFKDATWFLSQPAKKKLLKGSCILVGVLPNDHFLMLSPKVFKGETK